MIQRRIRLVLLTLALLAAQTLALLHGFVHLPGAGAAAGGVSMQAGQPGAAVSAPDCARRAHAAESHAMASLFGTHADDADCRLLDQLADAALPAAVLSIAALPVAGVWSAGWRDAALRILRPAPPGRGPPILA